MTDDQITWPACGYAGKATAPSRSRRPGGVTDIAAARPRRGRITASRDEWLTVEEVCDELNIGRRTFERWRTLGIAPRATRPTRNGPLRIKRSWLEEWAEDGAT